MAWICSGTSFGHGFEAWPILPQLLHWSVGGFFERDLEDEDERELFAEDFADHADVEASSSWVVSWVGVALCAKMTRSSPSGLLHCGRVFGTCLML